MTDSLFVSSTLVIPGADLSWTAIRASGPGGQNVNKVASKVELRFDLENCAVLDPETKTRLRSLAGSRMDAAGRLVIVSQATRDQQRNLADARAKLAALIEKASHRPRRRKATRPSASAERRRLAEKRHNAARKVSRSSRGSDD